MNSLGLDEVTFHLVERETIKLKLSLVDERFTFGGGLLSIDYLNRLNQYLFGDLYLGTRVLFDNEIYEINNLLASIKQIHSNKKDLEGLLTIFDALWNLQIFNTGNTRTLIAYFKIVCLAFNLPYDIDINGEIRSGFNAIRKLVITNDQAN